MNNEELNVGTGLVSDQRGITLIALIITIIVLLILAGVVLNLTIGERGIFNTAQDASQEYEISEIKEQIKLDILDKQAENMGNISDESLEEILLKYGTLSDEKNILNRTLSTNKGNHKIEVIDILNGTKLENNEPKENINIFKELEKNNKTVDDLNEYGMTVQRIGDNQTNYFDYNELYKLGQGSQSGINSNTFTLTIDYNTLISKLEDEQIKGINTEYYHKAWTHNSKYTSWIYSKIIIKYDDNTEKEVQTETLSACNQDLETEPSLTLMFEKDKKISQIQIIIEMYDSDYGHAGGYIKNIELVR